MSYFNEDTIAAIATSKNAPAALGIIRISGKNTLDILAKTLHCTSAFEPNKMVRMKVHDSEHETIDDGMVCFYQGPKSFTGEDMAELFLHGSPFVMQQVLQTILDTGFCRSAEPGEFSFRAFKNGKLDLAQAEAVSDLIHSNTIHASRSALRVLKGDVGRFADSLKKELVRLLALLEVEIDFSDQGVDSLDFDQWIGDCNRWIKSVEQAREQFKRTLPLREGIRTAIVGAPNSGKSTLFNRLLGENRSIVSDEMGTTRDVVREPVYLGDTLLLLADTAGIRETSNQIESEGIQRSFGEVRDAHLVLFLVDLTDSHADLQGFLAQINAENPDAKVVLIGNKVDLSGNRDLPSHGDVKAVYISALSGEGFSAAEDAIVSSFADINLDESDVHLSRLRHYEVLGKSSGYVVKAVARAEQGERMLDLLSSDLRDALSALHELTGEESAESVLSFIFSEFCIGK